MKDYSAMSLEELDAEIADLAQQRAMLHGLAKLATIARDAKLIETKAAQRVAEMSDEERAAMVAALTA